MMTKLSPSDEKNLMSAVEKAVVLSREGLPPNEALGKVASEFSFTPPQIRLITGAYNKARAVNFLKTAKAKEVEFPLADASIIISSIFKDNPENKVNKEAFKCNVADWSHTDIKYTKHEDLQKAASEDNSISKRSAYDTLLKFASVAKAVRVRLEESVQQHKYAFEKALNSSLDHMNRMSDKDLKKTAQLIVNGYKDPGKKFNKLAACRLGKDIPELEKSANAAIFPASEPYISVSNVFSSASKLASAQNALDRFQKEAEIGTTSLANFLTDTASRAAEEAGGSPETWQAMLKTPTTYTTLSEKLDPNFYNQMKEIELRRTLFNLFLYDKDLRKYEFKDLVDSYNNVVQIAPGVLDKPPILKNLILQDMESGGIKDIFEIKALTDLQKNIDAESRFKLLKQEQRQAEKLPPVVSEYTKGLGTGYVQDTAKKLTGILTGKIGEGVKTVEKGFEGRKKEKKDRAIARARLGEQFTSKIPAKELAPLLLDLDINTSKSELNEAFAKLVKQEDMSPRERALVQQAQSVMK